MTDRYNEVDEDDGLLSHCMMILTSLLGLQYLHVIKKNCFGDSRLGKVEDDNEDLG